MKKLVFSLAFVAFGTFAMAQENPQLLSKKMSPTQNAERKEAKLKQMQTELGLSNEQVVKLRALEEKRKNEMTAQKEERKQEMQANHQKHDAELKAILTPEQFTKYQDLRQKKMKSRAEKMRTQKVLPQQVKPQVEADVQ